MTLAARAMAPMKDFRLRSKRVAMRRQSLRRQNMRSMTLRVGYPSPPVHRASFYGATVLLSSSFLRHCDETKILR